MIQHKVVNRLNALLSQDAKHYQQYNDIYSLRTCARYFSIYSTGIGNPGCSMDAKYHLIILLIPLPIVWYVLFENGPLSPHLDIYAISSFETRRYC